MRLLCFRDDGSLSCTEFGRHNIPQYAILSHTWGDEEVTLQDLFYGTSTDLSGYRKITFCGEQAAKDGLKYFWVDTCCIDKRNLPELTKAINSMFRWYHNAAKCYVYLSDVSVPGTGNVEVDENFWMEAFQRSRWFTRGWTLQELIAPVSVDFFSAEGHLLGDKSTLELEITEITGIPIEALHGRSLSDFSASERFAWAENRETTEEEDIAYCLLGIFDVFMPLIYGEGEANALKRLERLVNESLNDNLLGGIEETEDHSDVNPPSSSILGGSRASNNRLEASDDEGRMRRKAYVLNALGATRALTLKPRLRRRKLPIILSPWHQALCLSRDVAQGANAGSIFQEAHVSFLNAVYWDEWPRFETFTDRSEMMTDLLSHCENAKHSSRLLLACKHIDAFSLRWTHFFTVVEFAMDIDPEWPCTVWGAIRLIFVVSAPSYYWSKLVLLNFP
jgi:Heterokaryon incompatibility protein (HET)